MSNIIYTYNGKEYDITTVIDTIKEYNDTGCEIDNVIADIFDLYEAPIIEVIKIANDIIEKYVPEKIEFCRYWTEEDKDKKQKQQEIINKQKQLTPQPSNIPKCPICQSTSIKKILVTSKTVSVGLFGIFSQKVKKQWHCNTCKSDF